MSPRSTDASSESAPSRPMARGDSITADARVLRALGHPVRLALFDALQDKPLSATEAGEAIGESATTCSFHLRQLQKHGLVRIHEVGPGRRRTWELVASSWTIPASSVRQDGSRPSDYEAILDRFLAKARDSVVALVADAEVGWAEASTSSQSNFYLTETELREFSARLDRQVEIFKQRFEDRARDARLRPRGTRRVEVVLFAVPSSREKA